MRDHEEGPVTVTPGDVIHEVRKYLHFLSAMGYRGGDCSTESVAVLQRWGTGAGGRKKDQTIADIESMAKGCRRCGARDIQAQVVFGSGNPEAVLMFVGDFPEDEDSRQGLPFIGDAGNLLTKIIQAMGFTRETVYLCHAIKCCAAEDPESWPGQMEACRYLLHRQIEMVQPDIICTLGPIATSALLDTRESFSRLRGRFHLYNDIRVMPTHHPKVLLKEEGKKRAVWEDMKIVMKAIREKEQRND
jgi:DNA polymerase